MKLYEEIEHDLQIMENLFDVDDLLEFKNTLLGDLDIYHFSLGIWIRNNLLTEKRALYKLFIENNIPHKDDISSLMIKLFHAYLHAKK